MFVVKHQGYGEKADVFHIPDEEIDEKTRNLLMELGLLSAGSDPQDLSADMAYLRKARIANEENRSLLRKEVIGAIVKGILGLLALGAAAWIGSKVK